MSTNPPDLSHYRLEDALWNREGRIFLSGTQALVKLMLLQRWRDRKRGLNTAGFVSGYRGSPLGHVDREIWHAGQRWLDEGLKFLPAINEDLAATAVLGTQRVELDPQRQVDGVFGLWYGKGPGVDRAGDAIKHGNAFGSSPKGGVLVVAGDDHGCVSSSMPHQSDQAFQAWHMPVVSPSNVQEILEYGLYGFALSRFTGGWVGLTALSEIVESSASVDLDELQQHCEDWKDSESVLQSTGYQYPFGGLHIRWPDLPSLEIEARALAKLEAAKVFASVNSIDHFIVNPPHASIGIVTVGKAHHDLMECLRRLQISKGQLYEAGVRIYKVGLSFPIESQRMKKFARELKAIFVVEEKGPIVEQQIQSLLYSTQANSRPSITGKFTVQGQPCLPGVGELRPSRIITQLATWLNEHLSTAPWKNLSTKVSDFVAPAVLSNAADGVRRSPYFCAGCPHNQSTKLPEGSTARAGIGCHFMANWMDRQTGGLIQMGGEGVDWVSQSLFSSTPHVFQNLGDGTYFHSGYMAIRQALAAGTRITYKILLNNAVAMTGGQPVDGQLSPLLIAQQVHAEGVKRIAMVTDDLAKYESQRLQFPKIVSFHDRSELERLQRELREFAGVSVLIYEQTCATELRRQRKKGEQSDDKARVFINSSVCEGCGDCTVQSNCVAVVPINTAVGRKRKIDQSTCNKDHSCVQGFCPSFVTVSGASLRRNQFSEDYFKALDHIIEQLPAPREQEWTGPYDLLVTGIGGTGVVTLGAVVAMAAHLEGKFASALDFMGFAQKGGAVLSFVRLAKHREMLNQARIDVQQADAIVAFDLVVAGSQEALQAIRANRTQVLLNLDETAISGSMANPDSQLPSQAILEKLQFAVGTTPLKQVAAQSSAHNYLGDSIMGNFVMLGYAWQAGLVPVSHAAMMRAIELNGVAVQLNQRAFGLGRALCAGTSLPGPSARASLKRQTFMSQPASTVNENSIFSTADYAEAMAFAAAELTAYQNSEYAKLYLERVERVRARELELLSNSEQALSLTKTYSASLFKLMMHKDEFEVARLYTNGEFEKQLEETFEGKPRLQFHFAPTWLAGIGKKNSDGPAYGHAERARKISFGPSILIILRMLARLRFLRGSVIDPFKYSKEHQQSLQYRREFIELIDQLLTKIEPSKLGLLTQLAALPQKLRGFGPVRATSFAELKAKEAQLLQQLDPQAFPPPVRTQPIILEPNRRQLMKDVR